MRRSGIPSRGFFPIPRAIPLVLLLSVWASACDEPLNEIEVPTRIAHEELRIGSLDGSEQYVFGRVSGIAVDDRGRIFVADLQGHSIRAFAHDGAYLFTVASQGSGPSDVSGPCCLAFAPDGLLWVRDNGNARYVAFEVGEDQARGVRTLRMNHSDVNRHAPTTFTETGELIDIGTLPDPDTGSPRSFLFHVGPDGSPAQRVPAPVAPDPDALVHRVETQVGDASVVRYFYQPYGPRHLIAYGPGGVHADAVSSEFEVRVYASDGSVRNVIARRSEDGPRLTEAQRVRADSLIANDARAARTAMPFRTPDRHAVLRALHFDQTGQLWVERTVQPEESREVEVYDSEGVLIERILYPPGLELTYGVVSDAMIVGVVRGELEVPYVVRFRLEPR